MLPFIPPLKSLNHLNMSENMIFPPFRCQALYQIPALYTDDVFAFKIVINNSSVHWLSWLCPSPRHQVMKWGRPRFEWCAPAVWRFNATAGLGLHQRLVLHGVPLSTAAQLELEGIRGLWSRLHFHLNNVLPAAAAVTLAYGNTKLWWFCWT